ncbi:hypothetical protein G6734_08710, partial [Polynucleobacter paneuropaeus]|nr:hypothetical protein [Polynucleobacter paneuropaeus]
VFLGSSGDDRAIGNNGHDVFKDFNAGDSFVGNAQTTIQIAQSNYLFDTTSVSSYLHIEQMSTSDFASVIDPQMSSFVHADLTALRLVSTQNIEGVPSSVIGFAQAGQIQIMDGNTVVDTLTLANTIITDPSDPLSGITQSVSGLHLSDHDSNLLGGAGNDVIIAGAGNDVIVGGGGNDWIAGSAGNDVLAGGNWAMAGTVVDPLFGTVAVTTDDHATLVAGSGDTTLVAIEGQVTAIGGTGQDTYAFYGSKAGLQVDLTIEHFKAGDKIDIS